MVKRQRLLAVVPALVLLTLFLTSVCLPCGSAAEIEYHLEKQWVKIWVNRDGTIDLQYTIRIVCDRGRISYVTFDQPVGDFTIGEAFDADDHQLKIEDATQGSDFKVKVLLYEPVTDGQSAEFTATTNVGHMIWKDEMNPGNVGLQFIPTSWSVGITDLRVLVVLPGEVSKEQIRVTPDWDNAYADPNEDGRLVIYWERKDVAPNTRFQVGISFPATSVEQYETTKTDVSPDLIVATAASLVIFVFIAIIVALVLLVRFLRRRYLDPTMRMETLGIRRGLTAVEASQGRHADRRRGSCRC